MNRESTNKSLQNLPRNTKDPKAKSAAEKHQITIKKTSPIISYTGRKRNRRFSLRSFILPLFSLILAYFLISVYAEKQLSERFPELAENQAEKYLLETVNLAVEEMAKEGLLTYSSMVKTIRDPQGEVIYLEVDTAMLAKARATLVKRIDSALENGGRITLSVPIGSLGGWNLFSGIGFPVRVRIYPIGMTAGEIYTVLEDCGINQTRHLIRLDVRVKLHLVLPDGSREVESELSIPLGERVLVGDVPEIYLDNIGGT